MTTSAAGGTRALRSPAAHGPGAHRGARGGSGQRAAHGAQCTAPTQSRGVWRGKKLTPQEAEKEGEIGMAFQLCCMHCSTEPGDMQNSFNRREKSGNKACSGLRGPNGFSHGGHSTNPLPGQGEGCEWSEIPAGCLHSPGGR